MMTTKTNPDFATELPAADREVLRPKAHNWIKKYLRTDISWHRCYYLKQKMTNEIGYCYQADMYQFLKDLGFEVKIDGSGDHLAMVTWR